MRLKTSLAAILFVAVFAVLGTNPASAQNQDINKKPEAKVVVQPGDSLTKIAEAHQTTYTRLFDANLQVAHPDVIHPGSEIRVPASDEQIPSRPLPAAPQPVAAAPVPRAAKPRPAAVPIDTSVNGGVWDRLAQCESGGNWAINTGNGYYGGLQFSLSSWRGVGGSGYPHQASKAEQISRAEMLKARQGWGAWPACTAKMGLR